MRDQNVSEAQMLANKNFSKFQGYKPLQKQLKFRKTAKRHEN